MDTHRLAGTIELALGHWLRSHLSRAQRRFQTSRLPRTDNMSLDQLLKLLESDNGALRDLAAQQISWRLQHSKQVVDSADINQSVAALEKLSSSAVRPTCALKRWVHWPD